MLCCLCSSCVFAQSKTSISAIGATLFTGINEQTQIDDMGLSVIVNLTSVEKANTVSIGVGATSLTADGISTIFEVVKANRTFYLVEQNVRAVIENGTVTVFVHLNGKPEDYQGKYAIVRVTDKEGHTSPSESVLIKWKE
ncbi:MAG: hypothetical protein JWO58_3123 [Chitinophagaceae bacterium]|nr:hypothetical protein [Chitinophagaceae bacterium]